MDASFAVEPHSDGLVGLHKLVELLGQLLVLHRDHTDVVVQRVDLHLQVRVVVKESGVAVSGTLEFFSHVHNLVFLGPDFGFEVLDARRQLDVSLALGVDPLLEVHILIAVLVLKSLQVI